MRVLILAIILAPFGVSQASIPTIPASTVLDDLEHRTLSALSSIAHASTKEQVDQQRTALGRKLDNSLHFDAARQQTPVSAWIYMPPGITTPAPAVMIVRPHDDPRGAVADIFATSLVRLGFVVLALDLRAAHENLALIPNGATPEGLMQREIRVALAYLLSEPEVDPHRIGIWGTGLVTTIAAAINPQFASVVLLDAAPDLKAEIGQMRTLRGKDLPDPCNLIPGLLRYASTEELFALIVPRPVLAINASRVVFDYATDLYRIMGSGERLYEIRSEESSREDRYAAYRWFAKWLQPSADLTAFAEPEMPVAPLTVQLLDPLTTKETSKRPLTASVLAELLGEALPTTKTTVFAQIALKQRVNLTTHLGIEIPVTLYRPGSTGGAVPNGRLFAIDDAGRDALDNDAIVQEAVRRQWEVWAIDPRGFGELKPEGEGLLFGGSLLLGENITWRQASDVGRIIESVINRVRVKVGLYAHGKISSLIAAYVAASATGDSPDWIALREPMTSLAQTADLPAYVLPYNALGTFDISDLLAVAKAKVIMLTGLNDLDEQWR